MAQITDLQRAYEALQGKQTLYTLLFAYYDGEAPLKYVSQRLYEVFQDREARFTENWVSVVLDSELDRIRLNEFDIAESERAPLNIDGEVTENPTQARLNELFAETELQLDADDVHRAMLVCGESFVFAWRADDDSETPGEIQAFYNDPRLCHVFYEADNPRKKRFAAKWWVNEEDQKRYLNLYYADKIEYYASTSKYSDIVNFKAFEPVEGGSADNPFGEIPIFHFRYDRRKIKSAMANVIEPQDAINKLFQDMMVAAEFGAFKQRYAITHADISALKNAPNIIWQIPAGDGEGESTQVGEFTPTDLDNYLKAMDHIANDIARISKTPKHYMFSQGGDPSGEALIAMEAPLNKKVQTTIDRLKPIWAQVAAFLLQLDGVDSITPKDITPLFDQPETIQPRTQAEIREINTRTGIPLINTLRREGWTEEEIKQLLDDKRMEAAMRAEAEVNNFVNGVFGDEDDEATETETRAEARSGTTANGNRASPVVVA